MTKLFTSSICFLFVQEYGPPMGITILKPYQIASATLISCDWKLWESGNDSRSPLQPQRSLDWKMWECEVAVWSIASPHFSYFTQDH